MATLAGSLTTAMAPMLKPVRRGPGIRGAYRSLLQSGVRDSKWTYEMAKHYPKAWSSSERKITSSANKMMEPWLSSCPRCAATMLHPTRPPAHRAVSSLVRGRLRASTHCVSLLAVHAQTSHLELKLNNVGQWMLNADAKLSTYSVLLALRANTLPLPLFGGGAVQTTGEQIQIFENGSVSIPGRSVRRPSLISSHLISFSLSSQSRVHTYTHVAMTRHLTLTVAQCTRDCGAMDVDRNHKEGGRHK